MQKLIAKYGLAAHLALLAVAPLILFPYCSEGEVAVVLAWLTLFAGVWTVFEPSMRLGEGSFDARYRVMSAIVRDPLFWASLFLVAFTGLRALNSGIAFCYHAETAKWFVAEPMFPIIPGVVGSAGTLPFVISIVLVVLLQACRHSLGRAARMAFLLLATSFSGIAGVSAVAAAFYGEVRPLAAFAVDGDLFSYVGFAFGLNLIGATVAMVDAFERHWGFAFFLLFFGIGGNAAGLFSFAPFYMSAGMTVVALVMLVYAFVYSVFALKDTAKYRFLAAWGIFLVVGGGALLFLLPEDVLTQRFDHYAQFQFFSEEFWGMRKVLSGVALKSWISHMWTGTGLDSFPLDFRFAATAEDWAAFPRGAALPPNGWLSLLTERGIVGAVLFVLPLGFLLFTYVRRLTGGILGNGMPQPACLVAPLFLISFIVVGFFDCSLLRSEVVLVVYSFIAISAASFQITRGGING